MTLIKAFIAVIVLIFSFQSWTKADECFAIENICLGDSALVYFSEKELNDSEYYYYNDKEFVTSVIDNHPSFETYETVEIDYKKTDKKYHILYINGRIFLEIEIILILCKIYFYFIFIFNIIYTFFNSIILFRCLFMFS